MCRCLQANHQDYYDWARKGGIEDTAAILAVVIHHHTTTVHAELYDEKPGRN